MKNQYVKSGKRKILMPYLQKLPVMLVSLAIPVLLILPSLINFSIIVNFQINREFISQSLCVNKEVKNSKCHGTCYLSKKLEEQKAEQARIPEERIREELGSKYVNNQLPLLFTTISVEHFFFPVLEEKTLPAHGFNLLKPPTSIG